MNAHSFDSSESDDRIEEAAARWFVERDEGFSSEQARDFERWLRADPRHAQAFAALEQASALLRKLPQIESDVRASAESIRSADPGAAIVAMPAASGSRRARYVRVVGPVLAIAAAIAVTAIIWRPAPAQPLLRLTTSGASHERRVLPDGSVVELNANSAADVEFTARERRVQLLAGEAHFSVAHDEARPFLVRAGAIAVRAVGTAFNVRLAAANVEVLVTEGKVRVSPTAQTFGAETSPLVEAGERARVARVADSFAPAIEKVDAATIQQELSWQKAMLVFADTPLHEVVAQFNQHARSQNGPQLSIADPELARRPVGGIFAANNVEVFVRLLETSGDVVADRRNEREIVLRKAR